MLAQVGAACRAAIGYPTWRNILPVDRDATYFERWAQRLSKDTGNDPAWTAADVREAEAMMAEPFCALYRDRYRD